MQYQSKATVLVIASEPEDAQVVLDLIQPEHPLSRRCLRTHDLCTDVDSVAPDILVLALHSLEETRQCLDQLHGTRRESRRESQKVLALVHKDELPAAYAMLLDREVDAYAHHWPFMPDALRLREEVLQLVRQLPVDRQGTLPLTPPSRHGLDRSEDRWTAVQRTLACDLTPVAIPTILWPIAPIGPRVMLVDDDAFQFKILRKMLSTQRVHVAWASCGSDALKAAADSPPDLILMDIHMPDMNGVEVLRQLRAGPAHPDLPVVMLSGNSDRIQVVQCLQLGARGFIVKPFSKQTLIDTLEKHLGPLAAIA